MPDALPARLPDEEALDDFLCRPDTGLRRDLAQAPGDLVILGVAGKMGPTLARLAKAADPSRRVVGVARFSDVAARDRLAGWGIETISCDLLDRDAVARLPDAPNVVFAAGRKFGASGAAPLTWAMNVHVPAIVAERYAGSRIVAFSTGNVYPMTRLGDPAPTEATLPGPLGEYAQSCLGRERMFEHFSSRHGTPGRIVRLNYAIDLRYGVLHDIAQKVFHGEPVDVSMGRVNVIWQGDANAWVLRLLAHCTTPSTPINVTGPETLSVRDLAEAFAERFGRPATIAGREADAALLNDASQAARLFGRPRVGVDAMLDWQAEWIRAGGTSLGKPTKFEVTDGRF